MKMDQPDNLLLLPSDQDHPLAETAKRAAAAGHFVVMGSRQLVERAATEARDAKKIIVNWPGGRAPVNTIAVGGPATIEAVENALKLSQGWLGIVI